MIPEPNRGLTDILGKLDREVYARVLQGQSALQIALTDNLGEGLENWYEQGLMQLRRDIRTPYVTIGGLLDRTKYAAKILWFRTAFEDVCFDGGRTHAMGFREALCGGTDFYDPMRRFGIVSPFPFDESPNSSERSNRFREYVWFMSGAGQANGAGHTSQLTLGLKELCRDGETDYTVVSDLYEKEDSVWHLGKDLRQFVDFVRNRAQQNEEPEVAQWIRKLYDIFNNAFPAFNDVDVSAAQFLDYDPDGDLAPNVILGLWGARFNNGYNRISFKLPNDAESQDVRREWMSDGCYKIHLGDQAFGKVQIRGSIDGNSKRDLGSVELSSVCGLYVRATESRYGKVGLRRNWWRKIEKDGDVRFGRTLLLCLPGLGTEPQFPKTLLNHYSVARNVETRISQVGQPQDYTLIVMVPRTSCDALVRVDLKGVLNCDFSFEIKPKPMAIVVRDCSEELVSENGEIICGDDDALVLSHACEVDWLVDGRKISSGTTLAVNAAGMDYGLAVEVECRSNEKRVCRPVKVVRFSTAVVVALKTGRTDGCPQEWRIDIEEDVEYAIEGCEICCISHVNAFGAGDSAEIRVRRPVSRTSWWIEERTNAPDEYIPHKLRSGAGSDLSRGDLARYRLAVPVAFVDTPVRCDEVISRLVEDDWCDPEERRWRGRYKVVSLETVVRRTEELSSVYSFGETLSQRTIYFGDSPIVRFEDSPASISWAKTVNGELGVYFPNGVKENAIKISVFTDNVQAQGFDLDKPLSEVVVSCDDATQHDDAGRFFPVTVLLQRCCELDAQGELWGVLTYKSETVTRKILLKADRILKLRVARSDRFLPPQASGMNSYYFSRLVNGVEGCQPTVPYADSRLVQYMRAHSDALQSDSWWFENGKAEGISLNKCMDLSDEEVGTMTLCLSAKAMAGAIGRSLSALPSGMIEVDRQQLISRVSVSRIAQYQRLRGTHYRFGSEGLERAVFAVKDNDQARAIFSYNPAFDGPVLCKRDGEWGCYLPVELEIPPVVRIYTDNPQSEYFEDGCSIADQTLAVGFNSLQSCVNQIWRGDQQGELYLALFFKDASVDPSFVAGNFLNADSCQVVRVVTHCFELYDRLSFDIDVLHNVAERVGRAFAVNCMEEAHVWSRSRLLRFYRAEHDEAMNAWIDNRFDTCLPIGIELSYETAKGSFARLMERGINFLSEPDFMCGMFDRFSEAIGYEGAIAIFRDQPRDEQVDAAGNGLCAAIVVCRDLRQRNVGSCKEMNECYRFDQLNNVVQDQRHWSLLLDDWPKCLESGWRELANGMRTLTAWIGLIDRICHATSSVYKTLMLTGILLGINLEVAWRKNRTLLVRGTPFYDLCLRLTYTAFMYRHDCDRESRWDAWRCLMRSMCATMRMIERM